MAKAVIGVALWFSLFVGTMSSRSWEALVASSELGPLDVGAISYIARSDPFFENLVMQNASATLTPTASPTALPTQTPTTASPTIPPSAAPSSTPSLAPTKIPELYSPMEAPSNPPANFFNYNSTDGANYGPGELGLLSDNGTFKVEIKNNKWGSVDTTSDSYWKEFTNDGWGPWKGILADFDVYSNMCESGSIQSPIDLKENGAVCDEFHEVRSKVRNRTYILPFKIELALQLFECLGWRLLGNR
jgi:hypothetical protein